MADNESTSNKDQAPKGKESVAAPLAGEKVSTGRTAAATPAKVTAKDLDELLSTIDRELVRFIELTEEPQPAGAVAEETGGPVADKHEEAAGPETEPFSAAELGALAAAFPEEPSGEEEEEDFAELLAPQQAAAAEAPAAPEEETFHGAGAQILDEAISRIDEEIAAAPDLKIQEFGEQQEERRTGAEEQFIIFSLEETDYAVAAVNIMEVGEILRITALPNVPHWLAGVANLRGDLISMVDLRLFFDLEQSALVGSNRMLVARDRDDQVVVGLLVDRVSAIRYLPTSRIEEPTAPLEDRVAPYLRGVIDHEGQMLVVLDFDKLLLAPEMQQFQQA